MKYIVIGAGIYGSTIARLLHDSKQDVVIFEKNVNPGGHCESENVDGIEIHKHGPHIFHTSNDEVWQFVNRFSEWYPFDLKVKVNYNNLYYSFPINLMTLTQVFGPNAIDDWQRNLIHIETPQNFEEMALKTVGSRIYEIFFKGYTKKQWGVDPSKLPASIFNRIPIRMDLNDQYFARHRNKYQGIPKLGYTQFIANMIENIPIEYNVNFSKKDITNVRDQKIIWSGPPDQLLDYTYGILPYRSLKFVLEKHNNTYQGTPIVNFTNESVPYTRITEHKLFTPNGQDIAHSIISKEYPASYEETKQPFYPINTAENNHTYQKYLTSIKKNTPIYY